MSELLSDEEMSANLAEGETLLTDAEMAQFEVSDLPPQVPVTKSIGKGLQQAITLGLSDELAGVAGAAGQAVAQGSLEGVLDAYAAARDEERAALKAAEEANPKSYLAGQVGGAVATLPLAVAKLPALAAEGAIAGFGTGEGDVWEQAKSTALGGVLGAAGKVGGDLIAKRGGDALDALKPLYDKIKDKVGLGAAQKWLETQAGKFAEKAAGVGRTQGERSKLIREYALGKVEEGEVGKKLLEQGIVKKGESSKQIAEKVYEAQQTAGQEIGKVTGEMLDIGPEEVQRRLLKKAEELSDYGPDVELRRQLQEKASTYAPKEGDEIAMLSGRKAQEFKSVRGKEADWASPNTDASAIENIAIREAMTETMSPAQREAYEAANRQYALLSPVSKSSAGQAAADEGKKLISVGTLPAMVLSGGGTVPALAGAAAYRAGQKRGASYAAGAMWDTAKLIEKAPDRLKGVLQSAVERGEKAFAATHYLLQQRDPEYAKATASEEE